MKIGDKVKLKNPDIKLYSNGIITGVLEKDIYRNVNGSPKKSYEKGDFYVSWEDNSKDLYSLNELILIDNADEKVSD
jgi:hypothetical protein